MLRFLVKQCVSSHSTLAHMPKRATDRAVGYDPYAVQDRIVKAYKVDVDPDSKWYLLEASQTGITEVKLVLSYTTTVPRAPQSKPVTKSDQWLFLGRNL